MGRRVSVHHFVANLTTRQYGPHPTSDLLGVDYVHEVPADAEFPRWLARVDLFTRFYLRRAAPVDFWVRVWWLDAPRQRTRFVEQFGPFPVPFQAHETVRDCVFRLANVPLPGVGLYAIRLTRRRPFGWRGSEFGIVTETHFRVER